MIGLASLQQLFVSQAQKILDTWGRVRDRGYNINTPPAGNPDRVDSLSQGERYFLAASDPYVQAALTNNRDISRLFVSAAGLEPNESGAFSPPQLIYTKPELGDDTQFDALATQYDELFDGGFGPILKSLHYPAMVWGRSIGENIWETENGITYAATIQSRDPQRYILSPPGSPPGVYQKNHVYSTPEKGGLTKMPDDKFLVFSLNPLFNNPYGQSLLYGHTLTRIESYVKVFLAYEAALLRAGSGLLLGEYGQKLRGDTAEAEAGRNLFTSELAKAQAGSVVVYDEENNVRAEKIPVEGDAFSDYDDKYVAMLSTLLTGSATALQQGKYGTYSSEESTTVRVKSEIEQADAAFMGLAFTYQFNGLFLRKNFANVRAIPQLQLIRPELITATVSEAQQPQAAAKSEITVRGVANENTQEQEA